MTYLLAAALLGGLVSAAAVPLAARAARRRRLLDVPNARSSHRTPTPRVGGVGIVLGALVAIGGTAALFEVPISGDALGLLTVLLVGAVVGFCDDIIGLGAGLRLLLYLVSAAGAVYFGAVVTVIHIPGAGALPLGTAGGVLFSVLFIAWYTNLTNFMDGINGIAGGTAVVTFTALFLLFHRGDARFEAVLSVSIAAACVGFLFYNFPRASVFMGDVGAIFLGLAAGALTLRAVTLGRIGTHGALLLMYPFVFDATFTLLRRMVARERFWRAHRTHIYQQLGDLGVGHVKTTALYVALSVGCAALGLSYERLSTGARVVAAVLLLGLSFAGAAAVLGQNRRRRAQSHREPEDGVAGENSGV